MIFICLFTFSHSHSVVYLICPDRWTVVEEHECNGCARPSVTVERQLVAFDRVDLIPVPVTLSAGTARRDIIVTRKLNIPPLPARFYTVSLTRTNDGTKN